MATRAAKLREHAPEPSAENRRAPRLPVVISRATLRKADTPPVDAVLHDLSIYGCRVMSSMKLREGDPLMLRFVGANPISAKVVWSDGIFSGCRFDEPIAKSLFRAFTLSGYKAAEA